MTSLRQLLTLALLPIFGLASGGACASDEEPDFADPDVAAEAANPDGIAYPTDNLGGEPRRNSFRGSRIPNFAFQGYRDGDRARGLETISLSEFYDPEQKHNIKILHIQVAATWCIICSSEIEATLTVKDPYRERGVVFLEVVVGGKNVGAGPSLGEVDAWIARHSSTITTAIDVRAKRLGGLGINPAAMPHDILVDARTMEILDSSVGAPLDVGKYVSDGLRWVAANAPSY